MNEGPLTISEKIFTDELGDDFLMDQKFFTFGLDDTVGQDTQEAGWVELVWLGWWVGRS